MRLDGEPERYVVPGDSGRAHFDVVIAWRGLSFAEQMGAGLTYSDDTGRRCVGESRTFTRALTIYSVLVCVPA